MKVVEFKPPQPSERVIEEAKVILARAEAGELHSLIWIADGPGVVQFGYTATDNLHLLMGHTARLQHILQMRADTGTEQE